jgi:hypothetical protein
VFEKELSLANSLLRTPPYFYNDLTGPQHPDVAATHMNMAMILQDSGQVAEGLVRLGMALEINKVQLTRLWS